MEVFCHTRHHWLTQIDVRNTLLVKIQQFKEFQILN